MESVKKGFWFVLFLFGLFAESRGSEEVEKITFERFGGKSDKIDHSYKCTFLGDAGVGKTQIMRRFAQDLFMDNIVSNTTTEDWGPLNYKIAEFPFKKEKIIEYVFGDTAGREDYIIHSISYSKNSDIVFFVYDINNKDSFVNIGNIWLNKFKENLSKEAKYVLVGNKIDLEGEKKVSKEEAEKFAKEKGMKYIEVSAKTGKGIFYIPLGNEKEISTVTASDENSLEYTLLKVTKELMVRDFNKDNKDNNTNNKVDPKKTDDSKDTGLCSCCNGCFLS